MAANRFQRARLARVLNYADARRHAKMTLPRGVFDYVDGGAEDERTLRRNTAAYAQLQFRPRMGTWVERPQLGVTLFGQQLSFPVITAPCGGMRLVHPEADTGVAAAAAAAGTVHVASSVSGVPLEDIAATAPGRHWFQLYRVWGRPGMENLVHRASAAGYAAIVATVDTQVGAKRERDWRNGYRASMRVDLANAVKLAPQLAPRPFWLARYVRDGMPFQIANTAAMGGVPAPLTAMTFTDSHSPTWEDIAWVREHYTGPLLAKGVLTAEDCKKAVDMGCNGVIVSNHGGRQLDGAPATIDVLPEVVAAAGGEIPVLVDGGVRRGADVLKALALGAKAVLVGRPYVWGLALAGQDGVAHMLDMIRAEMSRTMQLMGCESVADLDDSWLRRPGEGVPPRVPAPSALA